MIILFYSEKCNFCKKVIEYINKNNLNSYFKFINVDKLKTIPENITVVPTIIDTTIEAPLEGKKAFEYIVNQKYFYYPTNNVDIWKNSQIPKPNIQEDKRAIERHNFKFAPIDDKVEKNISTLNDDSNNSKTINLEKKPIINTNDAKLRALMKLRDNEINNYSRR